MAHNNIDLPFAGLANGAVQEKLNGELQKIFDNIHDNNTKATDKRSVTIKLEFIPDDEREIIKLESNFTTKLANVEGVGTTILTGRDIANGYIEAKELKSRVKGQTYIDTDEGTYKTDTGEPIDVVEQEMKKNQVINLQKKRG